MSCDVYMRETCLVMSHIYVRHVLLRLYTSVIYVRRVLYDDDIYERPEPSSYKTCLVMSISERHVLLWGGFDE